MDKVRIGVLGAYRGLSMVSFVARFPRAELVAVCDKYDVAIEKCKAKLAEMKTKCNPVFFNDFDEFIKFDMDAVVLANYANEHAPFAVKCLKAGKHVISEVLPCQTLKEAVELVETVEETGKIYAYAENYCYMPANAEFRKLYKEGKIGEFVYGECEYVHDCHDIWPDITYGDENHWRNNMYSTFYCTHSIGPIIHTTGLRPVSVVGFEVPLPQRMKDLGCKGGLGAGAAELITLENGAVVKSLHGCGAFIREPSSIWYSLYGQKGCMESDRWEEAAQRVNTYFEETKKHKRYMPKPVVVSKLSKKMSGHGGGDFYTMYYFVEKILGEPDGVNSIDVYEALDMFLPGIMAYKSILSGNNSFEVPNLRNKEDRDKYRNDTFTSDKKVAGDMLAPSISTGEVKIDKSVYEKVKMMYEEKNKK